MRGGQMSFNTKLINLLKADPRFVDDEGELVLAAVQDRAWKLDRDLVKLLLSDKDIKDKFFDEIEGHWIFNTNTFLDYISQKNFLDNSYTRFRNRIGLTIDGKFLRERGEVALTWPYKDCVLEGGQTKEEEKRKEIFFNEVLAQDEINRLLDPKVLTNFTRYTPKGKQPAKEFKRDENGVIRENLIIKGNSLLALHTLKTQFRGQLKLIYIDPPFNTGSDSFGYNDAFNHSAWLTFMKNRLESAKGLLTSTGIMCIHCSWHEYAYLTVLADEIFGRGNRLCVLNIQVRHPERILTGDKEYNDVIEYILVYKKDPKTKMPKMVKTKGDDDYVYAVTELEKGEEVKLGKGIVTVFRPGRYVIEKRTADASLLKRISIRGSIREKNSSGRFYVKYLENLIPDYPPETLFKVPGMGDDARGFRYFYLPQQGNKNGGYFQGKPVSSDVTEKPYPNFFDYSEEYNNVAAQGGVTFRNAKKPEELLEFLIDAFSSLGDIIADYHLGSGTTAAVAHKMGRQYIGIEQLDYGENDSVVRLQNVINGDKTGISEAVHWQGGGDFIYCELMKYNEAFMERIQDAKSSDELLQIWQEMAEGSFLNWYVNPSMPEEAVSSFIALGKEPGGFEKQKRLLAELLDKNQLYVNLSEIDDAQFKVSEEDKALNRAFYGEAYNV